MGALGLIALSLPPVPALAQEPASGGSSSTTTTDDNDLRAKPADDQSGLQRQIEALSPTTQEKPHAPPPPEVPPHFPPPPPPPPHYPPPPPPPPTIYGHDPEFCCAREGMVITYPITSDPLKPADEYEAPHDAAVGAIDVFLHDGAFFDDTSDLAVKALFYDIDWTRHWRSDVRSDRGGLMGYGWDFAFNKRILQVSSHSLANGLHLEEIGVDKPVLWYFDGAGHAVKWEEKHSEQRKVLNFDGNFTAWVTTYQSPPGEFREIERYVVMSPPATHPFREHPNVEPSEQIFFVVREKDGTRFVFNCRGQLIYILSRNDSRNHKVRVELDYDGDPNPLTQSPLLSKIIDADGRAYQVSNVPIDMGVVFTFYHGQLVSGRLPIRRVKSIHGAGVTVTYKYQNNDTTPVLQAVETTSGDAKARRWEYDYNGDELITDIRSPDAVAHAAAPGPGAKPLHIDYAGQKVSGQQLAQQTYKITYGGTVSVRDQPGNLSEYTLETVGGYHVVASLKITDADPSNGGPWTTRYQHNGDTQVTEVTNPLGDGVSYRYEPANASVTLGPIRDWYDHGLTYENNLARGNLLGLTRHGPGAPSAASARKYDKLYNQPIEETDPLGRTTRWSITDYDLPRNRGNPLKIDRPPVIQPDGAGLARPTVSVDYTPDGQTHTLTDGGQVTRYDYDATNGQVQQTTLPGGGWEKFEYDALGLVIRRETPDGKVQTDRNGLGQITRRTIDPGGLSLGETYEYDNDGNLTETSTELRDVFGAGAPAGLKGQPAGAREVTAQYDIAGHRVWQTVSAGKLSAKTTYEYSPAGDLVRSTAPALGGGAALVTTWRYDARHRLREMVEAKGSNAERTTIYEYDADGAQTAQTADGVRSTTRRDGLGRVDSATDPLGGQHSYVYDAMDQVTEHTVKGAAGTLRHVTVAWDGYGHPVRQSTDSFTGAPQVVTTAFSARLLATVSRQADGSETHSTYDDAGRLTDLVDNEGNTTHNTYDGKGHLTQTEVTAPERQVDRSTGGLVATPRTTSVTMAYDGAGRLTSVTTAQGQEQRFLDSLGEVRGALSPSGQLTTYAYDGLGRRTDMTTPLTAEHDDYTDGGLVKQRTVNGQAVSFEYDALGRVTKRTDAATGAVSRIDYAQRQATVTDPNGTGVTTTYNAAGQPLTEQVAQAMSTAVVADFQGFRIVGGATGASFTYDELGRVTKATAGASVVTRRYDGLDRIVEETQAWNGGGQTVKHDYADDFRSETITYPELAFSLKVERQADSLGRIVGVTAAGQPVATYDYSGLDRLALRTLPNGVETRFGYDDQQRLTGLEIVSGQGQGAGTLAWGATAAYDPAGISLVTEYRPAQAATPDTPAHDDEVLQTRIDRDPLGRPTSSSTTLSSLVRKAASQHLFTLGVFAGLVPGGTTAVAAMQALPAFSSPQVEVRGVVQEISGSFTTYGAAQTAQGGPRSVAEFSGLVVPPPSGQIGAAISSAVHAAGLGGDAVRSTRIDSFTYDGSGRITKVDSRGGFLGKVIGGVSSAADVSAVAAGSAHTAAGAQAFVYDANGNVVSDGRYLYAYDAHGRLTDVQDRWNVHGYRESLHFAYDAFGRRIFMRPERDGAPSGGLMAFGGSAWDPSRTWLIYDGDHVVADIRLDQPGAPGPRLMARYIYGARDGELVEMDRRPEAAAVSGKLVSLYLHEDFNGVVRWASTASGQLLPIANDSPLGSGADTSEAAAGADNMVGRTGVRAPYLAAGLRVDGFAGVRSRDDGARQGFDYRVAHSFLRDTAQNAIDESRTAEQNRLQVVAGAIAALPISIAVAGPTGAGVAALKGAGINVGFGLIRSEWNDEYYSLGDLAGDATQGAVFGLATAGVGQLGLAGAAAAGADVLTVASVGTAWDMGVHGARMEDSFLPNLAMAVAMHSASSVIGYAGGRAKAALLDGALAPVEIAPTEPAAVTEAVQGGAEAEAVTASSAVAETPQAVDPMANAAALPPAAAPPPQPGAGAITNRTVSCACNKGVLMQLYARLVRNPGNPALWTNGLPVRPRSLINAKGELTVPRINYFKGEFNCAACAMSLDLYLRKGALFVAEFAPPRVRQGHIQADMEALLESRFLDMSASKIETMIGYMPPGKGGIVFMEQPGGVGGHVFNVVNVGGRAVAIDMQAQGLGMKWHGSLSEMLNESGFGSSNVQLKLMLTGF